MNIPPRPRSTPSASSHLTEWSQSGNLNAWPRLCGEVCLMSTEFPSKQAITRTWHVVDAEDQVLGKLASKAAKILMGKHKASYTPFLDMGDHVVVINAAKIRLTGRKEQDKVYRHFTGYPGGLVEMGVRRVKT